MSTLYINNYVIILIFIALGLLLPIVALTLARFLRPHNPTDEKRTVYESGNEPIGDSRVQFRIKYYMFALLFVLFDVVIVFLYPWAVAFKELGLHAFVQMAIFAAIMVIGLLYAWKKKVLEWS